MIEVKHEGGLVYLDGHGITADEAEDLCRTIDAAARDARRWAVWAALDHERGIDIARLEASGLTHVEMRSRNVRSWYIGRRDGLPIVVTDHGERAARCPLEVGDGPPLEAQVYGGRKWRPVAELWEHRDIRAWRVVAS